MEKYKLTNQIRNRKKYRLWKEKVIKLANYKCSTKDCGLSGALQVHHKIPMNTILKINNIKTVEQAFNCRTLWDVNNGVCLCSCCHQAIHGFLEGWFESLKEEFENE